MGTIIKTDGSEQQVRPENGWRYELEELKKILGGCAATITLHDGRVMVINPYHALKYHINWQATEIASEADVLDGVEFIFGDVLICNEEEVL